MYTNEDLLENEKMSEILKINQIKTRQLNLKRKKRNRIKKILSGILVFLGSSFFMTALAILLIVIENIKF